MSDDLEDFLDTDGVEAEQLRQILIRAMIHYANNRPRSLQQHIGPSQAGTTCTRKLAYAINAESGPNNYTDPLPSMIGTAMHATMEDVMALKNAEEIRERQLQEAKLRPGFSEEFEDGVAEVAALLEALKQENTDLGYVRWLTETKVAEPIPGTCDLFDRDTGTVIDYKFLGPTTHKKYSTTPSDDYQTQVHLYGAGLVARGEKVKNVAIFMVPRSGKLRNAVLWMVPFDPERAAKAVARVKAVEYFSAELDVKAKPYRYKLFPATPSDSNCTFCPHFYPDADGANPYHCKGSAGKTDDKGHLIEEGE